MVALAWDASECAMLFRMVLVSHVRVTGANRDWAAVLVANTVFIAMHVLEHCREGRAEVAMHSVQYFEQVEDFSGTGIIAPRRNTRAAK